MLLSPLSLCSFWCAAAGNAKTPQLLWRIPTANPTVCPFFLISLSIIGIGRLVLALVLETMEKSGKARSLQEILAAKHALPAPVTTRDHSETSSHSMRIHPSQNGNDYKSMSYSTSDKAAPQSFDDTPIRPMIVDYKIPQPEESSKRMNAMNHIDHEPSLVALSSVIENHAFDDEQEEEAEMPSSSLTVLGDNTDLLQLLAGASVSPSFVPTPSGTNDSYPVYNTNASYVISGFGKNSVSEPSPNDDMIELYSTISMLKKENLDLQKEIEFIKKSKDAIIQETSLKTEQHIERLKLELQEQQQVNINYSRDNEQLQKELEMMKIDMEFLIKQKEEIEQNTYRRQDDSSSMKSELLSMKTELNKTKMEVHRCKGENGNLTRDNQTTVKELNDLRKHFDEEERRQQSIISDLQANIRKLEEVNLAIKNELGEKNTQIGRMMSDWMSLERNFKNATMENDNLKQRCTVLEASERELHQARYHISTLENDYRNLQGEVGTLRNQLQQQQAQNSFNSGGSRSYSTPSQPPYVPPSPVYVPPVPPRIDATYSSANRGGTSGSHYGSRYDEDYSKQPYGNYAENSSSSLGGSMSAVKSVAPKSLSSALGEVSELRRNSGPANTNQAPDRSNNSLANLLQGRKNGPEDGMGMSMSITGEGRGRKPLGQAIGNNVATPFATERTSEIMSNFDSMERDLTRCMTEKNGLMEESEK